MVFFAQGTPKITRRMKRKIQGVKGTKCQSKIKPWLRYQQWRTGCSCPYCDSEMVYQVEIKDDYRVKTGHIVCTICCEGVQTSL